MSCGLFQSLLQGPEALMEKVAHFGGPFSVSREGVVERLLPGALVWLSAHYRRHLTSILCTMIL